MGQLCTSAKVLQLLVLFGDANLEFKSLLIDVLPTAYLPFIMFHFSNFMFIDNDKQLLNRKIRTHSLKFQLSILGAFGI